MDYGIHIFQRVFIDNYYRGLDLTGGSGGVNENTFADLYMQVRDRGINMEQSCHDNHFGEVWIKGPGPSNHASGPGLRIATDGTQGGNSFTALQCLDMNVGVDLPGAFEVWFGTVVADNSFGNGVFMSGSCERIFFDTIWAASGGDGVWIEGDDSSLPTTNADKIHIGKLYARLNANHGLRIEGYTTQLTIDAVIAEDNARGIKFGGDGNEDIVIGTAVTVNNSEFGLDASRCGDNCIISNALIYDGIIGQGNLTKLTGARPGTGLFQNRGVATIQNGTSSVTVSHDLEGTPAMVFVTGEHGETADAYVSARTVATFTVTVPSAVSANRDVFWQAYSGRKAGVELLSNPDVETDTGSGSPQDWFASATGTEWSTAEYHSESHSLRLNVSAATADWRAKHFAVTGSLTYRVRGLFKGSGSAEAIEVRLVADIPANATNVYLALKTTKGDVQVAVRGVDGYTENSGTVALDNDEFRIEAGSQTVPSVFIEVTGYHV